MSAKALELVDVVLEGQVYSIPRCEVVDGEAIHPCGGTYLWCESCGLLACEECEGFAWVGCQEAPMSMVLVCQTCHACLRPCGCEMCRAGGSSLECLPDDN